MGLYPAARSPLLAFLCAKSFLFFSNLAFFGFVMSTFLSTVLTSQLLTMVIYICICCFSFMPPSGKDFLFLLFPQFTYGKVGATDVNATLHGRPRPVWHMPWPLSGLDSLHHKGI